MYPTRMSEREETHRQRFSKQRIIALTTFSILFVVLILNTRFTGSPPQIFSVNPHSGEPGDVMVIEGRFFGKKKLGDEVRIAGVSPATSEYLEWEESKISFVIPEEASSGLVRVVTKNGRSNAKVFANMKQIPVVVSGPVKPGHPFIQSVNPTIGGTGTLLTISGINFGLERGNSAVFFTWISEGAHEASHIRASMGNLDYESWGDREISVCIPDGAVSGNMFVTTDKGMSNTVFVEVEGGGTRLLLAKRTYSVRYSIVIESISAQSPNGLYLWVPQIPETPSQRNVQLIFREPAPFIENVSGSMLYSFRNLKPGEKYEVSVNYIFDRYAVETRLRSSQVSSSYKNRPVLYEKFTRADEYIPSDNQSLRRQAQLIVRNERNPYRRARLIYNYVRARLSPTMEAQPVDLIKTIELKRGNAYEYALLFCTLSRAAGVPARPVAGYLVDDDKKSIKHFWAEFYITDTGWIPVDPFLGDGAGLVPFDQTGDHGTFYFGSTDNRRIVISKGMVVLNPMDSEGQVVRRAERADFQTIHEEVIGNLTSYRATWSDLEILGVY